MKRIVTIQDISCLGKCSLTVALPIISAMGVEACVVPTAILSTHTMIDGYTFRDLTEDMPLICNHWKKENFIFDAIYTGYLGSKRQLAIVEEYFSSFKTKDNLIVVDPVMGDAGMLYPAFDKDFAHAMAKLCSKADIIIPNLTEAAFMLDEEYIASGYSLEYIQNLLKKLTALGAKTAVLTGVSFEEGKIGVMGYDAVANEFFHYFHEKINTSYHGTGDIFASVTVGALMNNIALPKALKIAADYTAKCIDITFNEPGAITYGVNFEYLLPELMQQIQK